MDNVTDEQLFQRVVAQREQMKKLAEQTVKAPITIANAEARSVLA